MSSTAPHIRIGTRGSDLALWQAHHVRDLLQARGATVEIVVLKTRGDQIQNVSFDKMEGKGFFTKEIEQALLEGDVDEKISMSFEATSKCSQDIELGFSGGGGWLKVTVKSAEGKTIDVATRKSPMLLGVTGVVDGKKRTSTCTVDEVATVLRMRRPVFMAAARQPTPEGEAIRQLLLITMHRQLLRATDQLRDVLASTAS